ncbi:MAG TPA: Gmad2 immunoglobulin-like domain-containing protein [Candidatus Limnocylindria bacterium]|nr:Gmad2 immunoglobulin-like domain-containing protein [Candidatus Limnocylindria bacterium]
MTNERDDEILGRALSRAIETIEADETPYDRSRMAVRTGHRGTRFWRVAALAASIALAGALGSTLLDRPAIDEPVGRQPSPTVVPTNTSAATATPAVTAQPTAIDHQRVFVHSLEGLPPTSQHLDGVGAQATAEDRIRSRLNALNNAVSGVSGTQLLADPRQIYVSSVRISGDTVTVEYALPSSGWPIRGAASMIAWQQQLVYTATEEPGIRRLLVTENGGTPTTIDQLFWDKALSREDVSGYGALQNEIVTEDQDRPCTPNCPSPSPARLSSNYSVDSFARGVARFVVQVDSGDWESFTVSGRVADDTATEWASKYALQIKVKGTETKPGLEIVDRSPLRAIQSVIADGSTTYELALDDQRPWRVALLPNPDRIIVDIGGFASSISATVAVYSPRPGDAGRQFTVSGLSRTFEATTSWRVVDPAGREVASGFTTASRGTSAVWGTYQISVQMPASVSGNVTLEVFWASPRDGADTGLVQVPLTVR